MTGHSYAGGLFLALCHDFRIMTSKSKICFSEILVGCGLGPGYNALACNLLNTQVTRQLVMGQKVKAPEALKMQAVDSVYNSEAEAEAYVTEFAKQFVPRA